MAITKVTRNMLTTGIVDNSNATAITIDSSENVGIGVTPEANWRSTVKALDLGATGAFWDGHNYSIFANNVYEHTDTDRKHKQNGFGSSIEQYLGTISFNRTTSGSADAVISGSTTMFLDTSGNVGIGTTSPVFKLHLKDAANTAVYQKFTNDTTGNTANDGSTIGIDSDGDFLVANAEAKDIKFFTSDAERMRINSSGEIQVGTTTDFASKFVVLEDRADHRGFTAECTSGSFADIAIDASCTRNTANATYRLYQGQRRGTAVVFSVNDAGNVQNVNNSFTGLSDQRLKTNIADAGSQWDDIKALKVRTYQWGMGNTGHTQLGVISQEVEAAGMNGLVEESLADEYHIAYDSSLEGEKIKSVKYSVLYMKAVKALQEAMTKIEALEARVTTLEG